MGAISRPAGTIVGPGGFDLEVWNELGFGSQFLNYENYYRSTTEPLAPVVGMSAIAGHGETGAGSEGDGEREGGTGGESDE